MSTGEPRKPARSNRRSAVRKAVRPSSRIECRKGSMGLGPNLTKAFLDISQSGIRLQVKAAFKAGEEAEILISGYGIRALKRAAEVAWAVAAEDGTWVVGFHFREPLTFQEAQQITKP